MPQRHIRDREKKPVEESIKVESAKQAELEKKLEERIQEIKGRENAVLSTFHLPQNLPGLSNVTQSQLNETIGLITRSGGMLNSNNPVMMGVGAMGLAYAIKPELVRGFLGSPFGTGLAGGFGSYMLGDTVGKMLGDSAILSTGAGGALGFAFGASLGVPVVGLVFGLFGGMFGGRSKRKAQRRAREQLERVYHKLEGAMGEAEDAQVKLAATREVQLAAFDNFLDHADIARQRLLSGKESIEAQRTRLDDQRDTNIGIIARNTNEINRTAGVKNEAIRRETNKILGRQKVQIGARGISDAGSSWYILGDTESMGLKAEQEVYFSRKTALTVEEQKYRELMREYGDMSNQLTDYATRIDAEVSGLKSDVKRTQKEFKANLTVLDIETERLHRRIDDIASSMHEVANKHSEYDGGKLSRKEDFRRVTGRFRKMYDSLQSTLHPTSNIYKKEEKLLERAEKEAGVLAAISLGEAIRTTRAGINPFDVLSTFGRV